MSGSLFLDQIYVFHLICQISSMNLTSWCCKQKHKCYGLCELYGIKSEKSANKLMYSKNVNVKNEGTLV